ncbi:MAG: porphobilinogen synthase [Deltaproteobacteria bacterium]|jgi:porphobilinogen synthase|nr:porphobilinogen synthase [Deltaproteobacteria bacterium]
MPFPKQRLGRLRRKEALRKMVRETHLRIDDLIFPVFVRSGKGQKVAISSMPGIFQYSIDTLCKELEEVQSLGIPAILLFGLPDSKDELGSQAYAPQGIVQQAIKEIKSSFPTLIVITDICLCAYTNHGHCGIIKDGVVENDQTLGILKKIALSQVEAGADMVAPSDMMDGRVGAIRTALDSNGFSHIPIMSYAAKYASQFYGPFREAADSAPQFGDRRSYQMDPANAEEALREIALDIEEGADIVMVKPALAYLDVIYRAKQKFDYPLAAYNVSGEYSMIKAAAMKGMIEEEGIMMEILQSIKRAGADFIITYFAKEAAKLLHK